MLVAALGELRAADGSLAREHLVSCHIAATFLGEEETLPAKPKAAFRAFGVVGSGKKELFCQESVAITNEQGVT